MTDTIVTWQIIEPPTFNYASMKVEPGRLELVEMPSPTLQSGQVLVEVAGCAICSPCFRDAEKIRGTNTTGPQPQRPLVYEISGTVVAGDKNWLGKEVLIPASIPCGRCDFCVTGQSHYCDNQKIPLGNTQPLSAIASHVPARSSDLIEITHRVSTLPLEHLAGVIDELTAPLQSILCASLSQGDLVMVIGGSAMGQYLVQMAKVFGVSVVIAVDVMPSSYGMLNNVANLVIDVTARDPETITTEIKTYIDKEGLPKTGWKIFNIGGNNSSLEQTAQDFLQYAKKLIKLGSSGDHVMDVMKGIAKSDGQIMGACGDWSEVHLQILQMVTSGKVQVSPFILTRPMSWIKEALAEMNVMGKDKRIILTTDDFGLDFSPDPKSCR